MMPVSTMGASCLVPAQGGNGAAFISQCTLPCTETQRVVFAYFADRPETSLVAAL